MSIRHHISDELLLDYAAGGLEEGWSLAVATHLAMCPHCRSRLRRFEDAGGALLETMPAISDPRDERDSWSALSARLAAEPVARDDRPAKPKSTVPGVRGGIPEPLRSSLGTEVDKLRWRALGLGAYHYPIKTSDPTVSVRLLRIPAGKPVPEHGHNGRELTLVLRGAFRDGDDRFGPGDLEETDEAINHQPIAEDGEDCICLAVTDAPLKFKSRLVRMIQPLIGI